MPASFRPGARRLSVAAAATAILALSACEIPSSEGNSEPEFPFRVNELGQLTLGESESGILGRSDPINARDGSAYKTYGINLDKGLLLRLSAEAEDFTPVLTLFAPDGTPLGTTANEGYYGSSEASLVRQTATDGRHLLVLSGGTAGDMGSFSLRVEELDEGGELDFPGTVTGALYQSGERHPTRGSAMRVYPFSLEEETALEIRLDSSDFDAYLTLARQEDGSVVAEDDDGGEGLNARIMAQVPAGDYEIWATSLGGNGMFTLSAQTTEIPEVADFVFGERYQGHLGFNRQPLPGSHRSGQPLRFELEEGGELTATMTSEAMDTYLVLTDANGTVIAQNDDAVGMGTNSQIVENLEAGEYTLWAASYGGSESGSFHLETRLATD